MPEKAIIARSFGRDSREEVVLFKKATAENCWQINNKEVYITTFLACQSSLADYVLGTDIEEASDHEREKQI
jgi:hypothetical protein